MTNKERIKDIYDMLAQGKLLDAFDKYYADNVDMQDVGHEYRPVGKAANREHEVQFMSGIEEFHGMGVDALTSDEEKGVTMVENWMDVTMKGVGRMKMEQVAVQYWENGLIVKERFYHK